MAKLKPELNFKEILSPWGYFDPETKSVTLRDNIHLKSKQFLDICKKNRIAILTDLFTEIPDDHE